MNLLCKIVLIYFCAINFAAFTVMFADKKRAKEHRWRISEGTLFLLAFLGGSPGAICGMFLFRHKTRHLYFRWSLPAILLLQIAVIAYVSWWIAACDAC